MIEATVTATEVKNRFGRYLQMVMNGGEVIITKNGQEVGRMIPRDRTVSFLTDALTGILQGDGDTDDAREEALKAKYEITD